ncbi:hypothetical protein SLE2022_217280 [Rubroshorea leprosula]
MSNSPSQAPTPTPTADESDADRVEYWCYHCSKRVSVETVENLPDVICRECKNGFVEVIQSVPSDADRHDDSSFTSQLEYVLRILRQVAREDNGTQPPPQDPQSEDDFFGVELDGWYNDEDDDDENDNVESVAVNVDEDEEDRSVDEIEENRNTGDDDDGDLRRITREEVLRRVRNRRRLIQNQLTGIRMGFGGNSIELRFDLLDSDGYIGNPEDYVDAAGFEELLQNLAESDIGRRGPPPAAKSAVSGLPMVEILSEAEAVVCVICKDVVGVGEFIKKLPCGHGYHGDCIVPWLGSRNSCPVCRFELPTDDAEYEEERNKRAPPSVAGPSASGAGNSGSS